MVGVVVTAVASIYIEDLLLKKQISYTTTTSVKFQSEIEHFYDKIETAYEFVLLDKDLENLLINPFSEHTVIYIENIQQNFLSMTMMNSSIVDIAILSPDFSYSDLYAADTLKVLSAPHQGSVKLDSIGIKNPSYMDFRDEAYLVFNKNVYGAYSQEFFGNHIGNILMSVDPSKSSIVLLDHENDYTHFALIDRAFKIFPTTLDYDISLDIIEKSVSPDDLNNAFLTNDLISVENSAYITYISYVPKIEYYIISSIDKRSLKTDLLPIKILIALLFFAIVSFILILSFVLLNHIVKPLNILSLSINKVSQSPFQQLENPILLEGSTEISTVSIEFNRMITEITLLNKQLLDATTEIYTVEIERNKAEISHLRSQINPHFLYNTLEVVRGLASEINSKEIAQISMSMGKIFRYSIESTTNATLSKELDIIKSYLSIQLIRFDNRFTVIENINSATLNVQVPKMILQPLIENATFHGLEPKLDSGILFIGSAIINNELQITIQDNGAGIPEDILFDLVHSLNENPTLDTSFSSHIGILNVHNRIRLEYGLEYGLTIESEQNIGTKMTILLPLKNEGV